MVSVPKFVILCVIRITTSCVFREILERTQVAAALLFWGLIGPGNLKICVKLGQPWLSTMQNCLTSTTDPRFAANPPYLWTLMWLGPTLRPYAVSFSKQLRTCQWGLHRNKERQPDQRCFSRTPVSSTHDDVACRLVDFNSCCKEVSVADV